jgi:hypothetical protein
LQLASELESQPKSDYADLPGKIREMVTAMPPIETERDRVKRELIEHSSRKKEKVVAPVLATPEKLSIDRAQKKQERELER